LKNKRASCTFGKGIAFRISTPGRAFSKGKSLKITTAGRTFGKGKSLKTTTAGRTFSNSTRGKKEFRSLSSQCDDKWVNN
jgi:hypothetical protein